MITGEAVLQTVISAAVSLVVTFIFTYTVRRWLDKKLADKEKRELEWEDRQRKMAVAESKRRHAAGRLFFWIYRSITKEPPNGELADAMEKYNIAEDEQKTLEREALAQYGTDGHNDR